MFIRITSIIEGSACQHKYFSEFHNEYRTSKEIDCDWARDKGLFKGYRWISDIKVGDTLVIGSDTELILSDIAEGNFTYEQVTPKYMNQTLYTDTNAFEVIEWISPKKALIRELKPIFADEEFPESTSKFESDPEALIFEVRMRKDGLFYQPKQKGCPYQPTEFPHYYYDLSF